MPTAPHPQNTDELYQALQENDRRPYGRTRTVTAEELVDAAEQFAEPRPLVHALLALQKAYNYGSEPRKSPVVFARVLTLFDEQPDAFDERLRHTLFWRFKWVAGALLALPEIPLASLRQWLTEMRDRYEKAGLELQPYYGQAYQLAAHVGEDTDLAYELWAGRSRTRLSDCEACEICERARHHLAAGDDERALCTWESVLAGQESCQEEPARSVSYALLPLLRTGAADRARELHLAGYRACRRNPSMSGEIGRHLEFCALTGNEARGLELLAENRNLFDEVESPLDQLSFLTGVEVLLQRVESLGHGGLPAAGYPGRTWTVAGLRAEIRGRGDDLAARFDARNGTTAHTDRRSARLDRAPLLDALELTLRTRGLDDVAPAAVPAAARTAAPVPESLSELILRARESAAEGHPDATAQWARLDTLVTAPDYVHPDDLAVGPFARLRADLLAEEASRLGEKDLFDEAAARYEEAAGLYDDAGEPGRAAVSRASALLAAAQLAPQGADEAEARAAALTDAHASMVRLHEAAGELAPYQEARLLRLRATVLGLRFQASRDEEHVAPVLAEVDLLEEFAGRHDIAGQVSGALLLRAGTHALRGDLPAAVSGTDTLLDRLRTHGPAWHLPHAFGMRGRLRLGLRDAQAAHADLTEALRLAAEWPADAVDTARLHGDLAQAGMRLGRPDEALRHLTRSAELELRHGSRLDAFCTYSNAAQITLELGRVEDCIALLDSLLAEPDVVAGEVDDRLVAQLRLSRARALHAGEDLKAATAEYAALAAESAGWDDDPASHAMIAAETAVLLAEGGEFGRAREAADQALAAHARTPRYEQLSNCLRELARLQTQQQGAEGLADALALLADAGRIADEARAAGYEAGGRDLDSALAYEHGRVNAYAGEYETALTALEEALTLLGEPGSEPVSGSGSEAGSGSRSDSGSEPDSGSGPGSGSESDSDSGSGHASGSRSRSGDKEHVGEWAECVRLAAVMEGLYLERPAPALARLDGAVARLGALGHAEEAEPLASLAARLRDED